MSNKSNNQIDWDLLEKEYKEFIEGFRRYFLEITESIEILKDNKSQSFGPHIRSQLCLALICADAYSRFYKIFQGERDYKNLDTDNKARFKNWMNKFVFTEDNEIYKKMKDVINCDASVVWRLRNSFLHFYSFPPVKQGQDTILFFFNVPKEQHEKIEEGLKSCGKKIVFIEINYLISAILEGAVIQFQYFTEMIKNEPRKYIDSIIFSNKIMKKENVSTILI